MAETPSGQAETPSGQAETPSGQADAPRRSSRAPRWWAAAGTFVVGLFVGGIIVGLLSGGSSDLPAATRTPAPTTAVEPTNGSPRSAGAGADATAEVVVNDACLRALNAAQDMYEAVQDLGEAASSFNAARLDEIVRRLQPLQERLRDNSTDCKVLTRLPDGSTASGTPTTAVASPTSTD